MEEIFLRHDDFAQRCVDALDPVPAQCGALFLIGGRAVGFDLFDRAITLRRLLPKLVRSVAIEALDRRSTDGAALKPELLLKIAEHFLAATSAVGVHQAAAVGMGSDLRLVSPKITGAALAANSQLVHASAFQL